jgi:hypothetical protein
LPKFECELVRLVFTTARQRGSNGCGFFYR